ncbi:MAG: PP2C family protein-serine/threonine phosphatase [Gammaproteobacteria bacterium]
MNEVKTLFAGTLNKPASIDLGDGSAALFSTPSPDKDTVNEDAAAVIPFGDNSIVLAVADGAGGHAKGDAAARIAIEALVDELQRNPDAVLRAGILNAFETAQAEINVRYPGSATTLVVGEITDGTARSYHVGDSGICIVGGRGKLKFQTVFHSPTGYGVEAGLLSEAQAMQHASRHVVSNIIGMSPMSVEIGVPLRLAPHDTVVIASDGLFDNLLSEEIAALACAGPIGSACAALATAATARMAGAMPGRIGKPDDLTVLLYRRCR